MALKNEITYGAIVNYAQDRNESLVKTIRETLGVDADKYSDDELCDAFLSAYMTKNVVKRKKFSANEMKKDSGLDVKDLFEDFSFSGIKHKTDMIRTKSELAYYEIQSGVVKVLTELSTALGTFMRSADFNKFTLKSLYENKSYQGYINSETACNRTLRTLSPNIISYTSRDGNTIFLTAYKPKRGNSSTNITNAGDVGQCYRMNLRQRFIALLRCFMLEYDIGSSIITCVLNNSSAELNEIFEVSTSSYGDACPICSYDDKRLWVRLDIEIENEAQQLLMLKALRGSASKLLKQDISDDEFNDFCERVRFYSAFDKVSQGDYNDLERPLRMVSEF